MMSDLNLKNSASFCFTSTVNYVQCGPSMMDSVDLYPSKTPIDITIDILFYYSKIWTIDITFDNLADRYPFGLDDRYHF